jgi:hypothetical protein
MVLGAILVTTPIASSVIVSLEVHTLVQQVEPRLIVDS